MTTDARIVMASDNRPEMDELLNFLETLDQSGKRSLLDFFQGAKFAQSLMISDRPGT